MADLRLRFLSGQRRGQELSFSGVRVRIGRSRDNDVLLPEEQSPTSSGHHAELIQVDRGWWIADLDSTNGTFVNENRVVPRKRERLRNGDRLGFGGGPPLLVVGLPERSGWLPLIALTLVVVTLALLGYGELRRTKLGFEPAAGSMAQSVYLIVLEEQGERHAVASAFAVGSNGLLATTAHVAAELEKAGALSTHGSARALALLTDSQSKPLPILDAYLHPDYESGSFRNDVALLQVAPEPPLISLRLADRTRLTELSRGVRVGVFGFPARSTDARSPRARLIEDVLGDIRGSRYIEIGRGIAPGMSGSPIFTRDGTVVGVVVGGDFGAAAGQGRGNWGLSVTALREMLDER